MPDRFFPYIDRLSRAFSLADCQRQCDLEDKFVCRSVNFETLVRDCALSSDDLVSMPPEALVPRHNSIYSEKGTCEQGKRIFVYSFIYKRKVICIYHFQGFLQNDDG